jgi:hypothetical protein
MDCGCRRDCETVWAVASRGCALSANFSRCDDLEMVAPACVPPPGARLLPSRLLPGVPRLGRRASPHHGVGTADLNRWFVAATLDYNAGRKGTKNS